MGSFLIVEFALGSQSLVMYYKMIVILTITWQHSLADDDGLNRLNMKEVVPSQDHL
jgi:hypothetical protein